MSVRKVGLCRGVGKLYVKLRISPAPVGLPKAEFEADSLAHLPIGIYPDVQGDSEIWVCEVPDLDIAGANVRILSFDGDSALGELKLSFAAAKWESRFNYRLRKSLCSSIRDYECRYERNRYDVSIERFLEGEGMVVWRLKVSWFGSFSSAPALKVYDGEGTLVSHQQWLFESQPAHDASIPHVQFVSIGLPTDLTKFFIVASAPESVSLSTIDSAPGFAAMIPSSYERYKYDSWLHMKDARADDAAYRKWFERHRVTKGLLAEQSAMVFPYQPLISIVTPCFRSNRKYLEELTDSVRAQSYPWWELIFVDAPSDRPSCVSRVQRQSGDKRIRTVSLKENLGIAGNTNAGVRAARGEYVAFLDHDDLLEPDALHEYVKAINASLVDGARPALLFCDEDLFECSGGWMQPVFKTRLNVDLLYSHNCVTHFLCVDKASLEDVGVPGAEVDGAQDYDVTLKMLETGLPCIHVPRILYHWRMHEESTSSDNLASKPYAQEAGRVALQAHFDRRGIAAGVEETEHPFVYRVRYGLPVPEPRVAIVIPNKDHIDILDECISSILNESTYSNYEIIVVENNSSDSRTFEYYDKMFARDRRLKLAVWEGEFNYSKIINFGASRTDAEYLIFLNNDTKVLSADWIEEMMGYLQRPEVGVVGAKLYFRDGLTQHAGMLVGPFGAVAHVNQDFPPSREGYLGRAVRPGNFSGVTGACQMVRHTVFDQIGGYSEELAVGFNDADFCLRLIEAGYFVTFTPYAELNHYEFVSRGRETVDSLKQRRWERERDYFVRRWAGVFEEGDPFTNPNLDRDSFYYALPDE